MEEFIDRRFWMEEHIEKSNSRFFRGVGSQALISEIRAFHTEKTFSLSDGWGFIGGTFSLVCKPGVDQRTSYSGHYPFSGIKFQSVMAPNGLVVNLNEP